MNNLEKIKVRIKEILKELDDLENQLENIKKSKRFVPRMGKKYFFIDIDGEIKPCVWANDKVDNYLLSTENAFETEELCEEVKIKEQTQLKFQHLSEDSWGDEVKDWENDEQLKFYYAYNHVKNGHRIMFDRTIQSQGAFYFKTEESLEQAIKEIGEKNILKYVLEV